MEKLDAYRFLCIIIVNKTHYIMKIIYSRNGGNVTHNNEIEVEQT